MQRNFITTSSRGLSILFTSTQLTSFIREDLAILQRHFKVEHYLTAGVASLVGIVARARHADCTYTWFASVYAAVVVFAAKKWRKDSFIVVGGVDVARYPEIGYGIWLSWWKSMLVKYALRNATRVLVVDPFLQREAQRLAAYDGANIAYVPTGYDPARWVSSAEKESFVLTVAGCDTEARMKVKGIDFLLAVARTMPDVQFVIVGLTQPLLAALQKETPENVSLVQFVEQHELLRYYQRAKVYCQPSVVEGFPNSVCEAMLCECVPVGTNVGGMPTAISDVGFLVPYGDGETLNDALRKALAGSGEMGVAARKYIAETFSLRRREEALLRILRGEAL